MHEVRRIARVEMNGGSRWVEVVDEALHALIGEPANMVRGPVLGALKDAKVLAPVEAHNKIVCLLDNFRGKLDRKGPGLFIKPNSCVIADGEDIVWPEGVGTVTFEAELAVVIGRKTKSISQDEALSAVLGYTVANDVTDFTALFADGLASPSIRFKMYDRFLPLGPWITTGLDGDNLQIRALLNGEVKQDASTSGLAFNISEIISWASSVMTLHPGDVICTGTPAGLCEMQPNDIIRCEIEGIGAITNKLLRPGAAARPTPELATTA